MKKTRQSVFIATSLDGFIARKDGDLDWLTGNDSNDDKSEEDYGYEEFISSIDALVMGRNTFEKVLTLGEWPYRKKLVVLTNRPLELSDKLKDQVEIMSGMPQEIVNDLSEREFYHLYIDGGKTIQRFLNSGLIQEMTITRVPVLIGQGIPLFGPVVKDIKLDHVSTKAFENGYVQSRYRVLHDN